jgi:hypothetical protein
MMTRYGAFMRHEVEKHNPLRIGTKAMITSIIVTAVIAGALGYALRQDGHGELIVHRPYNNRYNDASAARDYTLFE